MPIAEQPTAPPRPGERPSRAAAVEHPLDRRRRALIGTPLLLGLAAVFALSAIVPQVEAAAQERRAAVAEHQAALAGYEAAAGRFDDADTESAAARGDVAAVVALVAPIAVVEGAPIPEEARAALTAALDAAKRYTADAGDRPPVPTDSIVDPDGPVERIREETGMLGDAARRLDAAATERTAAAGAAEDAAAALGTAVGEHVTAVAKAGYAFLAAHPDAPSAKADALRSALDALPEADTEALPDLLAAVTAATAALG